MAMWDGISIWEGWACWLEAYKEYEVLEQLEIRKDRSYKTYASKVADPVSEERFNEIKKEFNENNDTDLKLNWSRSIKWDWIATTHSTKKMKEEWYNNLAA